MIITIVMIILILIMIIMMTLTMMTISAYDYVDETVKTIPVQECGDVPTTVEEEVCILHIFR